MGINPMKLMQYRAEWEKFLQRHPKLPGFFRRVGGEEMRAGTVFELRVKTQRGEELVSNICLTEEDAALIEELMREIGGR